MVQSEYQVARRQRDTEYGRDVLSASLACHRSCADQQQSAQGETNTPNLASIDRPFDCKLIDGELRR
jgi:hypothetical protein